MNTNKSFLTIATFLITLVQSTNAASYNALCVFSSSWADTQHGPHWQGHYSNGPMWPEFLSTNFGLAYVPANNFAVGGSLTDAVLSQAANFSPPANPELCLYHFWAGYTDFRGNADNFTNDVIWQSRISSRVGNISNAVLRLYDKGARSIVVPNVFDRSRVDPTFTKITTGPGSDVGNSRGAAWGDYDNDGFIDLFVAQLGPGGSGSARHFLYHNNTNGTFSRITTGPVAEVESAGRGAAWGDYDNDGYLDLVLVNTDQPNYLFHNNGDGSFAEVPDAAIVSDIAAHRSVSWVDYDSDGHVDLFGTTSLNQPRRLYHNNHDGTFTPITEGDFLTVPGGFFGVAWGDYNNDGRPDLFLPQANEPSGLPNYLYRNDGGGRHQCAGRSGCSGTLVPRVLVSALCFRPPSWAFARRCARSDARFLRLSAGTPSSLGRTGRPVASALSCWVRSNTSSRTNTSALRPSSGAAASPFSLSMHLYSAARNSLRGTGFFLTLSAGAGREKRERIA